MTRCQMTYIIYYGRATKIQQLAFDVLSMFGVPCLKLAQPQVDFRSGLATTRSDQMSKDLWPMFHDVATSKRSTAEARI